MNFRTIICILGVAPLTKCSRRGGDLFDLKSWHLQNNLIEHELEKPLTQKEELRQQYSSYYNSQYDSGGSWNSWSPAYNKRKSSHSSKLGLPALAPYPSYPPPLPLWAIHRPTRKYEPYFGPKRTTPSTTATTSVYTTSTTTTPPTTPATTTTFRPVVKPPCHGLPAYCDNVLPHLPLPLECIDICDVDFEELNSYCNPATGNLPLDCIEIIQAFRLLQRERRRQQQLERQKQQQQLELQQQQQQHGEQRGEQYEHQNDKLLVK